MHAISGCDTVSAFSGIGKKTAWQVWTSMENLHPLFNRLSNAPTEITSQDMDALERFVIVLYSKTCSVSRVNEARKILFAHGNRHIENIPPTVAALTQHVKRAVYQAGHVWGQAHICNPSLPSPSDWGWQQGGDGQWFSHW